MSIVQSNLFNPTSIPGCSLWLDAADRSTLTLSGTNVTQWNDKSGNGRNFSQPTSGSQPSLVQGGLNNLPTLRFATNFLSNAGFPLYNTTVSGLSFFTVFNTSSVNQQSSIFSQAWNGANNYTETEIGFSYASGGGYSLNNYGSIGLHRGNGAVTQTASNTLQINTTYVYSAVAGNSGVTPTSVILSLNGTQATSLDFSIGGGQSNGFYSPSQYPIFNSAVYLGARNDRGPIGNYMPGDIAEVILYPYSLTTSERQQLEGYLAWKWGLQASLPANHPYKSIPAYSAQPFPLVRGPAAMTSQSIFLPTVLPRCQLWLDAADPSIVTLSNSTITQLRDKSANAYVFSNASGFSYNVTKFRGVYPSFYRESIVNGLTLGSNASISFSQPMTFFTVCSIIDATGGGYIFDSITSNNRLAFLSFLGGRPTMFAGTELYNTISNAFLTPAIHSGIFNGVNSSLFLNGTLNITGTTGTQGATGLILGSRFSLEQCWTGHICEILMYNSVLTTSQMQQIEGYLAWKWGLQDSLPANHPYRSTPFYTSQPFPLLQTPRTLAPTVFLPTSVPSCQVWLDATDTASITFSGSAVSTWGDKTGNGHIATATGTITRSAVINGRQAMVWGANAFSTYFRGAVDNLTPRVTVFAVFSMNSSSFNSARVISLGVVNTPDFNNVAYTAAIERFGSLFNAFRNGSSLSGATATFGVPVVVCSEFTGAKHTFYLNGIESTPVASTGNFNYNIYQVGGSLGEENLVNYDGSVGEVLLYPSVLTRNERQSVEGYLAWKWGLQSSLPAGHPFKAFPPI